MVCVLQFSLPTCVPLSAFSTPHPMQYPFTLTIINACWNQWVLGNHSVCVKLKWPNNVYGPLCASHMCTMHTSVLILFFFLLMQYHALLQSPSQTPSLPMTEVLTCPSNFSPPPPLPHTGNIQVTWINHSVGWLYHNGSSCYMWVMTQGHYYNPTWCLSNWNLHDTPEFLLSSCCNDQHAQGLFG